jgi:DDE superfamily endonuclease
MIHIYEGKENSMKIWSEWWKVVEELRPACSRERTFFWLALAIAGFCTRSDLLGVTSFVRVFGLEAKLYDRLLDLFHSRGIDPDKLCRQWVKIALDKFPVTRLNGRIVLLGDGIKVPKTGKKMPGVKLLHQESDNNTKPEYIMGHSCQAISLVVDAQDSYFAVPLSTRIHEGIVFSNRDKRRLPEKMLSLVQLLGIPGPSFYFVADAYYACRGIGLGLLKEGAHLVSRVRNNAVAYFPAKPKKTPRRRGRPQLYGKKIRLWSLFDDPELMTVADSPVYGECGVKIQYRCIDLIWKPLRRVVRFVAAIHPTRGKAIYLCTDLTLPAIDVIRLYGIRFKIEHGFKQALYVLGTYTHHFWMMAYKSISRKSGNQYLHHEEDWYREGVRRKINAYHRHMQIGIIAQGMQQYLSCRFSSLVWSNFGSWIRTIRPGIPPSELITANALRSSLPEFLIGKSNAAAFTKFIRDRIDLGRTEGFRLAG